MRIGKEVVFLCIFLGIPLVSLTSPVYSFPISMAKTSTNPPILGDWIINTAVVKTNEIINLNGSVIIKENGSLTLSSVELVLSLKENSAPNGSFNITVFGGGTFTADSGTKIRTDDPNHLSWINITPRAEVIMANSTFENLGYDANHPVIQVENAKIQIINSTFYHRIPSSAVISLINTSDTLIQGNRITTTRGSGIRSSFGTNLTLERNELVTQEDSIVIENFENGSLTIQGNKLNSKIGLGINVTGQNNVDQHVNFQISDNVVERAKETGILVVGLRDVDIRSNEARNIEGSQGSIRIVASNDVHVSKNLISNSGDDAIVIENVNNAIISLNSMTWINTSLLTATGINITESSNITVQSNKISLVGGDGIYIAPEGKNVSVRYNVISHTNGKGIIMNEVSESIIDNNRLNNIKDTGISLISSSTLNISRNNIDDVQNDAISILNSVDFQVIDNFASFIQGASLKLVDSHHANITENLFLENSLGISLENSSFNLVHQNYVRDAFQYGIYCDTFSENNVFSRNVLFRNQYAIYTQGNSSPIYNNSIIRNVYGVWLLNSSANITIYLNDFIENVQQARDWGTSNSWSANLSVSEGQKGNYWSNYNGEDISEPLGVGDVPFNVTGNVADFYPRLTRVQSFSLPSISHPSDLTYEEDDKGKLILWVAYSELKPIRYEILLDDIDLLVGRWDGSAIAFTLDSLSIGKHTVVCTVFDFLEQANSDLVVVTVTEIQNRTLPIVPIPTSHDPDSPWVFFGRELIFIFTSLIVALLITAVIARTETK